MFNGVIVTCFFETIVHLGTAMAISEPLNKLFSHFKTISYSCQLVFLSKSLCFQNKTFIIGYAS